MKICRAMALGQLTRSVRPLPASLLLACAGVGAVVLGIAATMALVPVVIGVGLLAVFLVAGLLMGWAGLEALAALERWMERDARFKQ
jgi:hypothetical protein